MFAFVQPVCVELIVFCLCELQPWTPLPGTTPALRCGWLQLQYHELAGSIFPNWSAAAGPSVGTQQGLFCHVMVGLISKLCCLHLSCSGHAWFTGSCKRGCGRRLTARQGNISVQVHCSA